MPAMSAISISEEDQIKLARALVSPEKATRDKTCKSLAKFFKSVPILSDMEMLKLWKALYYCVWLSDKTDVQTELTKFLSNLIDSINSHDLLVLYIRMFYRTMLREWTLLDQHRLDKFYKFIRFFVRKSFAYFYKLDFPETYTMQFLQLLEEEVYCKVPNGIRYHIFDIFLVEMYIATEGSIQTSDFITFLKPLVRVFSRTKDVVCHERISKKVFIAYLTTFARENKSDASENDSATFTLVDTRAVQALLFTAAADSATNDSLRTNIYALHKQYAAKTGVAFVDESILSSYSSTRNSSIRSVQITAEPASEPNTSIEALTVSTKMKRKAKAEQQLDKTQTEPDPSPSSLISNVNVNTHLRHSNVASAINNSKHKLLNSFSAGALPSKTYEKVLNEKVPSIHTQEKHPPEHVPVSHKKLKLSSSGIKSAATEQVPKKLSATAEVPPSLPTEINEGKQMSQGSLPLQPAAVIPSKVFAGAKPGYAFKKGQLGLGYNADEFQLNNPKATSSSATTSANSTPRSNHTHANPCRTPPPARASNSSRVRDEKNEISPKQAVNSNRRVSFGKSKAKDYNSSVEALRLSEPSTVQQLSVTPKSVLKRKG